MSLFICFLKEYFSHKKGKAIDRHKVTPRKTRSKKSLRFDITVIISLTNKVKLLCYKNNKTNN